MFLPHDITEILLKVALKHYIPNLMFHEQGSKNLNYHITEQPPFVINNSFMTHVHQESFPPPIKLTDTI